MNSCQNEEGSQKTFEPFRRHEPNDKRLPLNPFLGGTATNTVDSSSDGPKRCLASTCDAGQPLLPTPCPIKVKLLSPGLCNDDLVEDSENEDEGIAISSKVSLTEWHVIDDRVPTLPPYHPLDRNSVFVSELPAFTIAARIQSKLHHRSINATYHPEIALFKCVARGVVDFRIQLYRGRGKFDHGFIVEVQRRDGFDMEYQMDVMAILDASQGMIEKGSAFLSKSATAVPVSAYGSTALELTSITSKCA